MIAPAPPQSITQNPQDRKARFGGRRCLFHVQKTKFLSFAHPATS